MKALGHSASWKSELRARPQRLQGWQQNATQTQDNVMGTGTYIYKQPAEVLAQAIPREPGQLLRVTVHWGVRRGA